MARRKQARRPSAYPRKSSLTPRQQRFVQEYLIDLNATQAAIRAGYSARTAEVQGPRLLGNVRVVEAIQSAQQALSERAECTQDEVMTDLKRQRDGAEKAAQWTAAIRATELRGKHIGMWKDKLDLGVSLSEDSRTELAAWLTALRQRGQTEGGATAEE